MTDFNVDVKVDPNKAVQGAKRVERGLQGIEKRADNAGKLIKRALGFLGAAVGIRELIRLADTFTNLQNRLRVVTSSTRELALATEELFEIAQRTRSSYEGTVELYSRVALAGKDLGITQKELTQFTESLNQAIILSGASAQEAQAGLIQFSQGIASGALRGDELRSVLEQLPVVADILAKELNITRGELRELGAQGAITSDIILKAFANARVELSERFARTVPTISQSFQVLRNAVVKTFGEFDKAVGGSRALSQAILVLANNVEPLARVTGALAITIGVALAGKAIPKAIAGFKALTAVIALNPIGAIVIGLTAAISLLITFSDRISLGAGRLASLRDVAIVVWQEIKAAAASFIDFFQTNFGFIADFARQIFGDIEFSIAGFVTASARFIDKEIGFWIGAFNVITTVWRQFPLVMKELAIDAVNAFISTLEKGVNAGINLFNKLAAAVNLPETLFIGTAELARFEQTAEGAGANLGKAIGEAYRAGFEFAGAENFVTKIFDKADQLAAKRQADAQKQTGGETQVAAARKAQADAFGPIIEGLETEAKLLGMTNAERAVAEQLLKIEKDIKRELTDIERERVEALIRSNQALETQNNLYNQIRGPVEEYKTTIAGLNALYESGKISAAEFAQAQMATQLGGALAGVQSSLVPESSQELSELANQLQQRQIIIAQARDAELINQQEYQSLSLALTQQYNDQIAQIESDRLQMQLRSGEQAFGALANAAKGYAGEQSSIYRGLFAVSKGFAAAEATVAIAQGIANAVKLGWPANIPAIAATVAQTAGLLETINGANFQNGGSFQVGGSGGPDSQMVAFRATPNETVSVRTPGQERAAMTAQAPASPAAQPISIVNVDDPGKLEDFMATPAGEKSVLNIIRRNPSQVKQFVS
jgi:tape measure domain-containing protein